MYTDLDEQELARRCSQGDRLAEDELYKRYAARVYTLCRRYLGDDEEAKDLMQESLLQALDKIQTFNGSKGSLYGWISRIAINKALNQIKRKRWRTVSLDAWSQDTIPEPTEAEMETIPEEKLLDWISIPAASPPESFPSPLPSAPGWYPVPMRPKRRSAIASF